MGSSPVQVRLAIVSELDLHGRGLQHMIDSTHRIETIGVAIPDGLVGYRLRSMQPDVVLIDADEEPTIMTALRIRLEMPDVRLLAIAPRIDRAVLRYAGAGIVGFVAGSSSPEELEAAILHVSEHGICCPDSVTKLLLRQISLNSSETPLHASLTRREREILVLLSQNRSNSEIASQLCIEMATTKNHVHNILEKLHVRSRREAALVWLELETAALSHAAVSAGGGALTVD